MTEDPFSNGMYRLVVNKGLDATVDGAWEWYREARRADQPHEVLRGHVIEVSRQCDEIVRRLFPDQSPFYSSMTAERIARLDGELEKIAPR